MDATALENEARTAIAATADPDALEELRVRYPRPQGELKQALREVRDRETGMALNAARAAIEEALMAAASVERRARRRVREDGGSITLPGEPFRRGSLHLITQLRRRIEDIFLGIGYEVYDGREVETDPTQLRRASICPRRIPPASARHLLPRRRDAAAHPDLALADQGDAGAGAACLPRLARPHLPPRPARRDAHARLPPGRRARRRSWHHAGRPRGHDRALLRRDLRRGAPHRVPHAFFPFTEPSVEFDITCYLCDGAGCAVCKHSGWIEMGGAGVVDPTCSRRSATTRRSGRGSRSGSGSTGSRSCATASPTCASSGGTTSAW